MRQLASLILVWSLHCWFQENLVESFILKCASGQITVQWPNGTFKECLNCAQCQPGRGLYPHKCGDIVTFPAITECKKCESGKTFSDTYDTSGCEACHLCAAHEVVTKHCTPSSDTKCKKACNFGYFFSKLQQVCKMCSYCCLDGKGEEQLQCINQGLKAVHRHCSPRPDRTCNPSTTTGSVISTEASSPSKHPNEPVAQYVKIVSIIIGSLLVFIILGAIYFQRKKIWRRRNRDSLNDPTQRLEQEWNPQGSHTGTPSQTDVVFDELSRRQPGRTEEERVSAGGHQRKSSRSNSNLNQFRKSPIHAVKEENPDQPSGQSWPPEHVTIKLSPNSPKIPQASSRVEFQCTVRGCQQLFYQWLKDEHELQGENNSTLILDPLKVQDFGFYKCEVRNGKRDDSSCVASEIVELDVTPAEGKSYTKLAEAFNSSLDLKDTVAYLLQEEGVAGYKHVAVNYKMKDLDLLKLRGCPKPGEEVLGYLESTNPDLTVYQFCKVLKGKKIRRLDIVNILVDYLMIDRNDARA